MKKLNIRLILILGITFVCGAVGIKLLHDYQMGRNVEQLLIRADRFGEEGNTEKEIQLLRRYMRHEPDDLDVLKRMLKTQREHSLSEASVVEFGKVFRALEVAILKHPEDEGLRREGYMTCRQAGRYTDALDHLLFLESNGSLTKEDRISLVITKWQTADQQGAYEDLTAMVGFDFDTGEFDESKVDPEKDCRDEVTAYTALTSLYMKDFAEDDDITVALRILEEGIKRNPEDHEGYLARARLKRQFIDGEEGSKQAVVDARKAYELAPEEYQTVQVLSSTLMMLEDFTAAEQVLNKAKEVMPDTPQVYQLSAELYQRQDDTERAIKEIEEGLSHSALNVDLLYNRALLELEVGDLEKAKQTVARLKEKPEFVPVYRRYLDGLVLIEERQFLEASQLFEKLLVETQNTRLRPKVEQQLRVCYTALNQPDKLKSLVAGKDDPNSQFMNAQTMIRQGQYAEAISILRELMTDERLEGTSKEPIFQELMTASIGQQLQKPEAQRDWRMVDSLANKQFEMMNATGATREYLEIDLLIRKGMESEALKRASQAMQRYAQEPKFRQMFARLTPDNEQALSMLRGLEQSYGDSPELRLLRLERLRRATPSDETLQQVLAVEEGLDKFPKVEDQRRIRGGIFAVLRQHGYANEALDVLRRLVPPEDRNINAWTSFFDIAFEAKNLDAMNEALAGVSQLPGGRESAEWAAFEARRQLFLNEQKDAQAASSDEILQLIQKAREERPDFAPFYVIEADAHLLAGQDDVAIDLLKKAIELRPNEVIYMRKLAELLMANGRNAEAQVVIQQMPSSAKQPNTVLDEIRLLLAQQDVQQAVARAEEAFDPNSDDFQALQTLADVYLAAKTPEKAVPLLQRSISLNPSHYRGWLVLVRTLVEMDRKEQATQVIEKSRQHVAEEDRPRLIGQLYATVGDWDKAIQSYNEGLQQNPNNTVILRNIATLYLGTKQSEESKQVLERMVAIQDPESAEDQGNVAWARRQLAAALAATNDFSDFQRAKGLLEENKNSRGKLVGVDLMEWLRICATRSDSESRRLAETRLEEIEKERSLNLGEKAILANLYYLDGRWSEAKSTLLDIIANNPDRPDYVSTYIQWLLERGETTDAMTYLRRLPAGAPATIRYTAIILAQQGKLKEARAHVLKHNPKVLDDAQCATVFEELGEYNEAFYNLAKKLWQRQLTKTPEAVSRYVEFLIRLPNGGGLQDALRLAKSELANAVKTKNAQSAQYYLQVSLRALAEARSDLPQDAKEYEIVRSWLPLGKQAGLDDLSVAWNEITYYDVRRDEAKLRELYNAFLSRPDVTDLQRAVVRNNLAYIHAINNNGQEALKVIGGAIDQLGPRNDFLDTRGLAYLVNGQVENALKDLRTASAGRGDASTLFHLALAEHEASNNAEAAAALKKAIELGLKEKELWGPEVERLRKLKQQLQAELQQLSSTP